MKRATLFPVVLSLLFASTILAQEPGDTLWTRTYGGSSYEEAYSVGQTTEGGYIIAGRTESFGAGGSDVWLLKTDGNGDTLWARTYGGGDSDQGRSVQQTTDGGYIIAGFIEDANYVGNLYLIKTDADGDTLWTWRYEGDDYAYVYSVRQTTDGGYILTGKTGPLLEDYDAWLVKTDADGDTLWTRRYGGGDHQEAYAVWQTTDGGYVVTGETGTCPDFDVYLWKTDADGNTTWSRTYGGSDYDRGYSLQQTTDGGYIIAGTTESFGAGYQDIYLVKTDADGDTLWTRVYGKSQEDYAYSVRQATDGGYVIVGYTQSGRDLNIWLLKTDVDGDTIWTRTYGGTGIESAYSVQQSTDGGYVVAGYTDSFGAGYNDVYLLKVAGDQVEPDVSIQIVPDDPPVTVPQGGSFRYTGTITNNTEDPQTTDIWVMAVGPLEGVYGPFKEFYDFPLDPGQSRSAHFNQRVPNLAPLGFYNYIAYCGEYPSRVIDSSFFQIEVITGPLTKAAEAGWILTGSFPERDLSELPSESALLSSYPNPFNARTVISYELPTTSGVKLEIYNICGQKVATVVDGQQEAGYRSVTWDACEVSSGIYFYKLTAGDFSEVKRMTLLR
jgi:hypothetical protein